ncbi:hypothetical protein AcetOrient_orf04408 [Acetobacter orientalis]|uniref:Uncharacterized protein n=1 Tax=Acetobacter orientalis TaxID=146474 RepID=A0A2Z5ZKV0_9PROT|nr:hypothetical protein AcetOrient_orf04408 [Acetobacter orientalis]
MHANFSMVAAESDDEKEAEANAHLIAAAPELYEALADLVKVLEMAFPSLDNTKSVKSALSALAKARGET